MMLGWYISLFLLLHLLAEGEHWLSSPVSLKPPSKTVFLYLNSSFPACMCTSTYHLSSPPPRLLLASCYCCLTVLHIRAAQMMSLPSPTGLLGLSGLFGHRPAQRSAVRDVEAGKQTQPGGFLDARTRWHTPRCVFFWVWTFVSGLSAGAVRSGQSHLRGAAMSGGFTEEVRRDHPVLHAGPGLYRLHRWRRLHGQHTHTHTFTHSVILWSQSGFSEHSSSCEGKHLFVDVSLRNTPPIFERWTHWRTNVSNFLEVNQENI